MEALCPKQSKRVWTEIEMSEGELNIHCPEDFMRERTTLVMIDGVRAQLPTRPVLALAIVAWLPRDGSHH